MGNAHSFRCSIRHLAVSYWSLGQVHFDQQLCRECTASVLVGAFALNDKAICGLLDPGGYYFSVEVWAFFFLPFHCAVSALIAGALGFTMWVVQLDQAT